MRKPRTAIRRTQVSCQPELAAMIQELGEYRVAADTGIPRSTISRWRREPAFRISAQRAAAILLYCEQAIHNAP